MTRPDRTAAGERNGVGRRTSSATGAVSFRARYRGADGVQHSRTFRTRKQAEAWVKAQQVARDQGGWLDPALGRTVYGEWADEWLDEVVNPDLRPKTLAGYRSLIETHVKPTFGRRALVDITPHQVTKWLNHLRRGGLSRSRIRQALQVFRASLDAAVNARYLIANPAAAVKTPRQPRATLERAPLTADELARLIDAGRDRWGPLLMVLGLGGLRWGEAVALRVADCELLHRRIQVRRSLAEVGGEFVFGPTKTGATRTVQIPGALRDRLGVVIAGRGPHELVFPGPGGGPLRHSTFYRRVWPRLKAEAGIDAGLRIHDLRHTAASLLIRDGASPKEVQHHLGHSSITVTMDIYAHLYGDTRDAISDRLERIFAAAESPLRPDGTAKPLKPVDGQGSSA